MKLPKNFFLPTWVIKNIHVGFRVFHVDVFVRGRNASILSGDLSVSLAPKLIVTP